MHTSSEVCWFLEADERHPGRQSGDESSFVGGLPCLPPEAPLPRCQLCNEVLTFYLQVAFPDGHAWRDYSLAVFACTMCWDDRFLTPKLFSTTPAGPELPDDFARSYQVNFCLMVFPTAVATLRSEYPIWILFTPWKLRRSHQPRRRGNKIGGTSNLVIKDECPGFELCPAFVSSCYRFSRADGRSDPPHLRRYRNSANLLRAHRPMNRTVGGIRGQECGAWGPSNPLRSFPAWETSGPFRPPGWAKSFPDQVPRTQAHPCPHRSPGPGPVKIPWPGNLPEDCVMARALRQLHSGTYPGPDAQPLGRKGEVEKVRACHLARTVDASGTHWPARPPPASSPRCQKGAKPPWWTNHPVPLS
jgi:hypothetical protein